MLTVRTRLLGSFLVVVALMIAIGIVAIARMDSVDSEPKRFGDRTVPAMQDLLTVVATTHMIREARAGRDLDTTRRSC